MAIYILRHFKNYSLGIFDINFEKRFTVRKVLDSLQNHMVYYLYVLEMLGSISIFHEEYLFACLIKYKLKFPSMVTIWL